MDIEVFLMNNADLRALLNETQFKLIADEYKERAKNAKSRDAGNLKMSTGRTKAREAARPFLDAVGWVADTLDTEYEKIQQHMKPMYHTNERGSRDLGLRLLSMTGISWNVESHNRPRDYPGPALALALEVAVIPRYRKGLLDASAGAARLRKEIYDQFLEASLPRPTDDDDVGFVQFWEFPDQLPLPETINPGTCDIATITSVWEAARARSLSAQEDPAFVILKSLEKNKYLRSSAPGADPDALESLAHFLIGGLVQVC